MPAHGLSAKRHGAPSGELVPLRPAAVDDEELVRGLVAGRPAAVTALYDRYGAMVRGVLIRSLGSAADADDLTQDTFITVVARVATLRDPAALRSFVVSVAMRIARNELRKQAIRRFVGLGGDVADVPVNPAADPGVTEAMRHLYAALDCIGVENRLAFVLRQVEGYELAEVADACGCSLATIKRRLARAEARFQALARRDPVLRDFLEGDKP